MFDCQAVGHFPNIDISADALPAPSRDNSDMESCLDHSAETNFFASRYHLGRTACVVAALNTDVLCLVTYMK